MRIRKSSRIVERIATSHLGFLSYASQVRYHFLCHGKPMKVVVASAECYKIWFDKRACTTTPYIIFLSYVPHGQCWAMRLPLMNRIVHGDEMLPRYNERLVAAFEGIVVTPAVSMITHRFGARLGNDLDDDEFIALVNGGNVTKDAWKAVFEGVATEKQEKLVYNSHFYKLMMAWAALNVGHADDEQMKLLENTHFYKLKMAWKAFNDGSFTKDQKELLENNHFYKLKIAEKAKKEGLANKEQLALIEKGRHGKDWEEHLDELKEFKKTHGHCDVPGDVGLAQWVSKQRTAKVKLDLGEPTHLTSEKVKDLDDLGFDWKPKNSRILKQINANGPGEQQNGTQVKNKGSWSREEDCCLIKEHFWYGNNWKKIASLVKTRNNEQCRKRAEGSSRLKRGQGLLSEHSYTATSDTTWSFVAEDGYVYGPYSNDGMREWVRRGLPGDAAISRNRTGLFAPMGLYFTDSSRAFLSIDKLTDAVDETNALVEEKALKFWL